MSETVYEPSAAFAGDPKHTVTLRVDRDNGDVYLECSSRLALIELAKSLLAEAESGDGRVEYYPLISGGEGLVVNGARFTEGSSRLFVTYPEKRGAA